MCRIGSGCHLYDFLMGNVFDLRPFDLSLFPHKDVLVGIA